MQKVRQDGNRKKQRENCTAHRRSAKMKKLRNGINMREEKED